MNSAQEFKAFIAKGNVVDLAVAVVIGSAFGKIIAALVEGFIMPLVSYVLPACNWQTFALGKFQVGKLLGAGLDFLLIALVVFFVFVKGLARLVNKKPAPPPEPTTKTCPYCREPVALIATRCKHCTSQLEG